LFLSLAHVDGLWRISQVDHAFSPTERQR
jgi:hypothetical protein